MKRITITDNSTGKVYRPRIQTIINWLDNDQGSWEWHGATQVYVPKVTERNWIEHVALRNILDLAAAHWHGKNCTFFRNKELSDIGIYGQIVEPCSTGGLNCVTPRIWIEVSVDGNSVNNTTELREALKGE